METTKEKGSVKCDLCNWKEESEDIASWYKKLCPKCGKGIIIDDVDMELLKGIGELRRMGIVLPHGTKRKDVVKARVDSAALKNFIKIKKND